LEAVLVNSSPVFGVFKGRRNIINAFSPVELLLTPEKSAKTENCTISTLKLKAANPWSREVPLLVILMLISSRIAMVRARLVGTDSQPLRTGTSLRATLKVYS
jgi:hypothetical protein